MLCCDFRWVLLCWVKLFDVYSFACCLRCVVSFYLFCCMLVIVLLVDIC